MSEPVALVALAIDAGIGWPPALYRLAGHPVGAFAWVLIFAERRYNHGSETRRRLAGAATIVLLLTGTILLCELLTHAARAAGSPWSWLLIGLMAFPGLAQRSLNDHVAPIRTALMTGDLSRSRVLLARIVGRDTGALDRAGVSRAAIESLAESLCDGVVAPFFWLMIAGLPGLWAYKALNTADSLIGHREPRWRAFGWASARADDIANLVPARLSAVLLCLVAGRGWSTVRRDAGKHDSPNAGWPEAAMAGALRLRLAGPAHYDGLVYAKPWIGDGPSDANETDILQALRLYRRACFGLWVIAGGGAWLL